MARRRRSRNVANRGPRNFRSPATITHAIPFRRPPNKRFLGAAEPLRSRARSMRARLLLPAARPGRRSSGNPGISIFSPVERTFVSRAVRPRTCRQKSQNKTDRPRFSAGIGARQWAISRLRRELRCKS